MDSHKFNMVAGGAIGSLLLYLLLGFFAELIYVGGGHHEHEVLAYAVEVEEAEADAGEAEIDWAALVAAADPVAGEKVFKKCKACHQVADGATGVGPHLWSVVGRPIGSVADFGYSGDLADHGGDWTLENLQAFLKSPKTFAPGTKMNFAGLRKPEDQINVIVYLNEADGSPEPLTE